MPYPSVRDFARDKRAYEMRQDGYIYKDIGSVFGVTKMRAWQLVKRHERWLKTQEWKAKNALSS